MESGAKARALHNLSECQGVYEIARAFGVRAPWRRFPFGARVRHVVQSALKAATAISFGQKRNWMHHAKRQPALPDPILNLQETAGISSRHRMCARDQNVIDFAIQ